MGIAVTEMWAAQVRAETGHITSDRSAVGVEVQPRRWHAPRWVGAFAAVLFASFSVAATLLSAQTSDSALKNAAAKVDVGSKPAPSAQLSSATPAEECVAGRPNGVANPCDRTHIRHAAVQVPEPASLFLVGGGLLSIAALVRRRVVRRQSS